MNGIVTLAGRDIFLRRAAERLHMDPARLSRILSGKQDPQTIRFGTLAALVELFEFPSVEALIDAIEARRRSLECAATPSADAHGGDETPISSGVSVPSASS